MPSGLLSEEERSRRPVVYPVARRLRIPFFIMRKFLLSAYGCGRSAICALCYGQFQPHGAVIRTIDIVFYPVSYTHLSRALLLRPVRGRRTGGARHHAGGRVGDRAFHVGALFRFFFRLGLHFGLCWFVAGRFFVFIQIRVGDTLMEKPRQDAGKTFRQLMKVFECQFGLVKLALGEDRCV